MLIVGERINSSRSPIAKAMEERNHDFIVAEVRKQDQAGADYIDLNAGAFLETELETLKWAVDIAQKETEKPLTVDSADPMVLQGILPSLSQPPMINSINLEKRLLETILPLAVENGSKLIALCKSDDKMADTADEKLEMADRLVEAAGQAGLALDDLYIDPLVYPVSTDTKSAMYTLQAIEAIMNRHQGVHTICGLTNVSYGLPERKLVNRAFLTAAVSKGLDAAILDPTDDKLFSALKAGLMIMGQDDYCMEYITTFRAGRLS